ncbi:MAG: hypothetical protein HYY04_05660 [Chloroflexi bacterium]|nr:hypothetical protein [Chloroflexota bacterium]
MNVDLKHSMGLAGQNLLNCLCPTRNYLPYWALDVDRDYRAEFRFSWPAHNLGRWWDAMLRLEAATDFALPAREEGAMLENLRRFFDNPDNLCFAPLDWEGVEPRFELHSLRESLLALNALVRYRNSRWAAQQGHRMLETIRRVSRPDGSWDIAGFDYGRRTTNLIARHQDPTGSNGRLIEALVWFYEATGDPLALELADRFARYHLANTTRPEGEFNDASRADHTHSYLGTLRGLLLFGELTGQQGYVDAVLATYRVTVRRMVKESGFTAHDLGTDRRGETTSPGDAAQLALWLARHGHPEFLDDAERIVRARLLPSQVTACSDLRPRTDDGRDEHANLNERVIGGLGGMHTEPHAGKHNVTDVTAAGLHTLIDIYQHIAFQTRAGLTVYLHLDYEDERVRVTSERAEQARVAIVLKGTTGRDNVLIRVPRWTPAESVSLTVDGRSCSSLMLGPFAYVPASATSGQPGAEIVLMYALPVHTALETTDGVEYEFTWRGDDVVGIHPNSDFFPFYPTARTRTLPARGEGVPPGGAVR